MAKYELQGKFFDGEVLHEEIGSIIELPNDVEPSMVLKPLDRAAETAVRKRDEREAVAFELSRRPTPSDPFYIRDEVRKANPEQFRDLPAVDEEKETAPQKKRKSSSEVLTSGSEDE